MLTNLLTHSLTHSLTDAFSQAKLDNGCDYGLNFFTVWSQFIPRTEMCPFPQPQDVQCMHHGHTFVLLCVPVLFADNARCWFTIARYGFPQAVLDSSQSVHQKLIAAKDIGVFHCKLHTVISAKQTIIWWHSQALHMHSMGHIVNFLPHWDVHI